MSELTDTTIRTTLFNIPRKLRMKKIGKYAVLETPVSKDVFGVYSRFLSNLSLLARLAYMDAGIMRKFMLDPLFESGTSEQRNNLITRLDNQYSSLRVPKNMADRFGNTEHPMRSYTIDEMPAAPKGELPFASYFSTPDDLTGMVVRYNDGIAISFKGSSSFKNFLQDAKSQIIPADLRTMMPAGTVMSSTNLPKNVVVPKSFIKPIQTYWKLLKSLIETYKTETPSKLYITGHSLGGAFATMFAFIAAECGRKELPWITNLHLITFGAPTTLSDGARNVFNAHLDSGYMTLDRVTSYGKLQGDVISTVPIGYTHPGYRPLKTELAPETNTGRAYHLEEYLPRVYTGQTGGFLFTGPEKAKYEKDTKEHMSNLVTVPVGYKAQGFPHVQYLGITYFGAPRMPGMKNAGYNDGKKSMTFLADFYPSGLTHRYIDGPSVPEAPTVKPGDNTIPAAAATGAGGRRTRRNTLGRRRRYTRRT